MRRLTSIVAVNQDGAIGCGNLLPWRIKSDMAFFRQTTSGNCVIMGRKTHDSLQKCLPNRYNIVLSKQLHLFDDQPECVLRYSVDEALEQAEACPRKYSEIFVIGGSTMYDQFDAVVDRYLITIVDKKVSDADAFFDVGVLNRVTDWNVSKLSDWQQNDGDEAPYQIWELTSCHAEQRIAARQAAVDNLLAKRKPKAKTSDRASKAEIPSTSLAFGW